jgi:hypothetical protein
MTKPAITEYKRRKWLSERREGGEQIIQYTELLKIKFIIE